MTTISSLTGQSGFVAGDLMVMVDVSDTTMAVTGTDKKTTLGALGTYLRGIPANAQATPGNPTATASLTLVMMGLGLAGCAITPASSGKVLVNVTGQVAVATALGIQATWGGRFGTGTAPSNGAAVSGTRFGAAADYTTQTYVAADKVPFAITALLTLTPATAYWFDIALDTGNASDSASITNVGFTAVEIS